VLHHDDGVHSEDVAGKRKAAKHIVGHASAGIADDKCFTKVETEDGEHVDAGIHARDHRKTTAGASIGNVRTGGGVPIVRVKKVDDLRHGVWLGAQPPSAQMQSLIVSVQRRLRR
jgi:hypothetical protein